MNIGIDLIVANLGMSFENIILFITSVGGIIFYAMDVRLGLLLHFIGTSLIFMWFYQAGYNYTFAIVSMFIWLVLMCFSLYTYKQRSGQVIA